MHKKQNPVKKLDFVLKYITPAQGIISLGNG